MTGLVLVECCVQTDSGGAYRVAYGAGLTGLIFNEWAPTLNYVSLGAHQVALGLIGRAMNV